MFVCKNCGEKFDTQVKFCNKCGSSMIEPEFESYSAGSVYDAPTAPVSPAGKILGIISMVCGIVGVFFAIIAFICSFVPYAGLIYSIIFLAFGIASLVLSSMSRNKGFTGSMAGAGKALGLVTTIICAISFLISIIVTASY